MVDVRSKQCAYRECAKLPSYGTEGTRKMEFCSEHKRAGMVNLRNPRCVYQGCSKFPSYGTEGRRKLEFCSEHQRAGMVNLRSKQCVYQGCSKFPSYGTEGSKTTECCREHKRAGMVNVIDKRCAYQGCYTKPYFGSEGSKKAEFCNEHRIPGMVDVINKRCAYQGCSKRPLYGSDGSSKTEFCGEHKRAGMVNVITKRCAHQGCSKKPSFGSEGCRKTEFCSEHKRAGMVDVSNKRCVSEGCFKYAVYGQDGRRQKLLLCSRHFKEGHYAGASPVEAAKAREADKEIQDEASGQAALPNTRKQALMVKRFPREASESLDCGPSRGKQRRVIENDKRGPSQEAEQDSALVRESSTPPSPTGFTPIASQGSIDQSRETLNLGGSDRALPRERRRSTSFESERYGVRDIGIDSCFLASKPAQLMPTQGVVHTNTGRGNVTGSAGTTGSVDGAVRCGGGGERVQAGGGGSFIKSRCAGAGTDVFTTSSHGNRHSRASWAFVDKDRCKIASLEQGKREAVVEANNLRDKVVQLEKQAADVAVDRAHEVAEATKRVAEDYTETVQTLRDELGAASRSLKESNVALETVCEERKALRQQVISAASKIRAEAANTEKVQEGFQQRIEGLRAELRATSTGWENTMDDLKQLEAQVVFDADIASKVAAIYIALRDRVKSVKSVPGTAVQAKKKDTVDTISPGPADGVVEGGGVDDNTGLSELESEEPGEGAASPVIFLDVSTVAIKPEG